LLPRMICLVAPCLVSDFLNRVVMAYSWGRLSTTNRSGLGVEYAIVKLMLQPDWNGTRIGVKRYAECVAS
jgi:hypothetical protein